MQHVIEECRVTHEPYAKAYADVQHAAEQATQRATELLEKIFDFPDERVPETLPHMTQIQVDAKEIYGHLALGVYRYQNAMRTLMKMAKEERRHG
jgi:hypothetical protein